MGDLRLVTTTSTANPNTHDLYLDDSGQLEWLGGDIEDQESYARMVAQRVHCRLQFVRGEWYIDQRLGTPWRERIWQKGATASSVRRVVKDVLRDTPGIRAVQSVDVEVNKASRSATITWEATTETNKRVSSEILDAPFVVEIPYD